MAQSSGAAPLRIGTRGSPLALVQARTVRARLAVALGVNEAAIEIVIIRTSGDAIQDRPLAEVGGKGLFLSREFKNFTKARVFGARLGPDGQRLLTTGDDDATRIWDVQTGLPLTPPLEYQVFVNQARFSADGKRVITADARGIARIWKCDLCVTRKELAHFAENHMVRPLSPEERKHFLHEESIK